MSLILQAKAKLSSLHHQQQKPTIKSSTPSKSTSSAVHFGEMEISAVIQVPEEDDELLGSRKRKRSPAVIQDSEEDDELQGSRKRKRSLSTAVSDEIPPSKRQTTNKREPWLDVTPL